MYTFEERVSYEYNKDGIRTKKAYDGKTHTYTLDGTNIIKEKVTGSNPYTAEYFYDLDGTACGLKYGGNAYYFYKNLQGDVIAITDNAGTVIVRYTYDAWGKCTIESDTSGVGIATINPFRYRSYYYDAETELYYLQSRYYDPNVGRFINADQEDLFAEDGVVLYNKYCYGQNNPVNNKDDSGTAIVTIVKKVLDVILSIAGGLAGMYLADVLSNIIQGKKDYTQPVQSPGAYLAEAVRSAGIAIFGSKLLQRLILAIGVTAVKAITDMIAGRKVTILNILGDFILNVLLTVVACKWDKISKMLKKVKNKKAIENKFKQCIANIAQHIVSIFKNIWQGLQSCIQMFYKRFSLKMITSLATNIFNLIR